MTDQLISFETAKLAKEKGFQELTHKIDWVDNERYCIPTQSLLQKWLREKHDIHIIVKVFGNSKSNLRTYATDIFLIGNKLITGRRKVENTYEEALETALFEALKLIENE